MEGYLTHLQDAVIVYSPNVIAAAIVGILGWLLVKAITGVIRRTLTRANVDGTLTGFLGNMTYMGGMAFVIIATLGRLGVNTASFAAVIAAAGLAIGFALQGSLGNFAAGVMLILFRPFKTGDYVEAAGVSGSVEEVQIFATIIRTPDNKQVIVGNASVMGGSITNYSAKPTRRVDLVFGIGYDDDLRRAKSVIEEIIAKDSRILQDPAPVVAVLELADSSVNFAVRPWVNTPDYWDVAFDLNEAIKLTFDAEGISIPFPQQDVHMISAA
jgi:small conductance mechanosensitive channel